MQMLKGNLWEFRDQTGLASVFFIHNWQTLTVNFSRPKALEGIILENRQKKTTPVCTEEKTTTRTSKWAKGALKCPNSGQALLSICVVQETCG